MGGKLTNARAVTWLGESHGSRSKILESECGCPPIVVKFVEKLCLSILPFADWRRVASLEHCGSVVWCDGSPRTHRHKFRVILPAGDDGWFNLPPITSLLYSALGHTVVPGVLLGVPATAQPEW